LELSNLAQLRKAIDNIRKISGVISVQRTKGAVLDE